MLNKGVSLKRLKGRKERDFEIENVRKSNTIIKRVKYHMLNCLSYLSNYVYSFLEQILKMSSKYLSREMHCTCNNYAT